MNKLKMFLTKTSKTAISLNKLNTYKFSYYLKDYAFAEYIWIGKFHYFSKKKYNLDKKKYFFFYNNIFLYANY